MKFNKLLVGLVAAIMMAGSLVATAQENQVSRCATAQENQMSLEQVKTALQALSGGLAANVAALADQCVSACLIIAAVGEGSGPDAVVSVISVLISRGANPADVTTCAIAAGANATAVITAAITAAPKAAAAIVTAAINAGVPSPVVTSAAIAAGADPTTVTTAAAAGGPPASGFGIGNTGLAAGGGFITGSGGGTPLSPN